MTEVCTEFNSIASDEKLQPLIRVIGIGSPYGADRVGWLACDLLQTALQQEQFAWHLCRTPTQLPQLVQDCDGVIIIDALLSEDPVEHVISLTWPVEHNHFPSRCSSHALNVIEALQLASQLDQLPSHTYLLGVSVSKNDLDASRIVDNALPQLQQELNRIADLITRAR